MNLLLHSRCLVRKLKNVPRQSWVKLPKDSRVPYADQDLSHLNIQYYRDIKMTYQRGLDKHVVPRPLSPFLHPLPVKNPKVLSKIYRWCSCGLSLKQPLCDGSHKGTAFKPFKFVLDEPVKEIMLCACKLTSNKPFCDGESCKLGAKYIPPVEEKRNRRRGKLQPNHQTNSSVTQAQNTKESPKPRSPPKSPEQQSAQRGN